MRYRMAGVLILTAALSGHAAADEKDYPFAAKVTGTGKPMILVPGLGFTPTGYRIGRGMGFYDRFLAQSDFLGRSCGLAFQEQVVETLPVLDHDVPLSMLVTDTGIRRFASTSVIQQG